MYPNVRLCSAGILISRTFSIATPANISNDITILGHKYSIDKWTNITPNIVSKLGKNLHVTPYHPLSYVRQRIVNYFNSEFRNGVGEPIFTVYTNMSPIVSTAENFDSLLVSKGHPSRTKSDSYYINEDTMLRTHTTAHQAKLLSMGLDNFIIMGDVYRRDEIDSTHYPVFHQADAVRLCTADELSGNVSNSDGLKIFEQQGKETAEKQGCHTLESVKIMEHQLKSTLTGLAQSLFGKDIQCRWVEEYFPFTHPSWELEICFDEKWVEVLGCGIMRQEIIQNSKVTDRIGWAFGLGLERIAMHLYGIPDIRLFWSTDTGFLNQFKVEDCNTPVTYKPISQYPQCKNDISFWLPNDGDYSSKDFYDVVRSIGGDKVEQVILKDVFVHPTTKKVSHCYTIVYRDRNRTLLKSEVNVIHNNIKMHITNKLRVTVR